MTTNHVAVLLIVGRHSVAGTIDHSSSRVLDVLNDVNAEFLRVHGVAVFRGIQGGPIVQFDEVTVPKSAIDCAILTEDRHEAPLRRQYALVEKCPHPVFAVLTDYEVRGTAMLERSVDPVLVLNSGASHFFPIVTANVSSVDSKGPPLAAKVVFVNKTRVSLLQIEKRAIAPASAG